MGACGAIDDSSRGGDRVVMTPTADLDDSPIAPQVAVLVAEGFQDAEAYMTIGYLTNHGCDVKVIGIETGTVKAYNSDFTIDIEKSVSEASPEYFDALVLPGGKGPAELRENEEVLEFVRAFWKTEKPVAAICHGPQVLISAGLMDGKTATGVSGIKEELEAAGVTYLDESVVVQGQLITSRVPDDLFIFSKTIAEAIEKSDKKH